MCCFHVAGISGVFVGELLLCGEFPRVVVGFHDASHFCFGRIDCKSEDGGLLFSVREECDHGHGLIG